jgi:hypothetical protein
MAQSGRTLVPRPDRQESPRGIFASVSDLIASIQSYIDTNNADPKPKPYLWTATAEPILAKVARARTALNQRAS